MNYVFVLAVLAGGAMSLSACWMAWLLLRQNGRILLRLDALEKRLEPFEGGDATGAASEPIGSLTPDAEPCDVTGEPLRPHIAGARQPWFKRAARRPVAVTVATLHWLMLRVARAHSAVASLELNRFKFLPRPDDIFIVTYPRSGTTWMQMILYQLTTDGSMEIPHIAQHSPWFERSADSDQGYEDRAAPRVFKSHLPFEQIPKGPGRYIYVARDGRDVAVSYFDFYCSHNGYKGTFAEFFELFLRGRVMFGSWAQHVCDWWSHRHELNVLFLTYEELMADIEGCLRRIITFCRLNVPEEKLPLILERCSFPFMKQHENKFDPVFEGMWRRGVRFNSFVRAGRVGEGVRQLTKEQQARFACAFQAQVGPVASNWPAAGFLRNRAFWQGAEVKPAGAGCN